MAYKLFCESFDTWTTSNASRWTLTAGATIQSSIGRRGTSALRINAGNNGTQTATTATFADSSHVVIGFAVNRVYRITSASYHDVIFRSGAAAIATLRIDTDGKLRITLGGTTYASVNAINDGVMYSMQIGIQVGDSGSFEVRVNGTSTGWLNLTGVDTKPSTIGTINNIVLSPFGSGAGTAQIQVIFDDLYITYGDELKWLGDIRVDALALTANSTPQDWTPDTGNAWERLNNTSDGYITGTTLDDESLFALADYTPATTAIHGVQVCAYARKTDAGSRSMAIKVKSDTTTDVGDTIALGDTTTEYRQVWLADPDTASAWTDGGLDALEIGVKVMD